ncbi:MAG: pyridoxal phosphate-dependent aminotransferase, partial [Candidatus Kariarchaeaceae archaeon]
MISKTESKEEKKHIVDQISLGKIVQIRDQLLKTQASGQKVYRFESGDPNFSVAPHIAQAMSDALQSGKTHYTPNAGILELRTAIKEKLALKNNIDLPSTDSIYVTNGAMNGLFATFTSVLDPGDEVILPDPMWTEIGENIRLGGGIPISVPLLAENDYEYSVSDIEDKISKKTKAIFLNTPHNPT